jgi:hypothetical protein
MNPKTVASDPQRHPKYEPLYDIDPCTGATIEVFYADRVHTGLKGTGWFYWSCKRGEVPAWPPVGPFTTSYRAFKDATRSAHATLRTRQ